MTVEVKSLEIYISLEDISVILYDQVNFILRLFSIINPII